MRIITGSARGCRLKTPKGAATTRPTADRVKESLFNIIGARTIDARVLDIFAGTGNLGLEALSRGATKAIFIDKATRELITFNAKITKLADKAEILAGDAFNELSRLAAAKEEFNLIFTDPPYHLGLWQKTLSYLDTTDLLARSGVLIVEHGADENDLPPLTRLECVMNRRYGHTTQLSFFQWKDYLAEAD